VIIEVGRLAIFVGVHSKFIRYTIRDLTTSSVKSFVK
jgi:hypothetical protein